MPDSYYVTKNKDIPLNDRAPGELAEISKKQLEVWRELAWDWPVISELPEDGGANRCAVCMQNLWFTADKFGTVYQYSTEDILSLIVAHLRQNHSEVINGID